MNTELPADQATCLDSQQQKIVTAWWQQLADKDRLELLDLIVNSWRPRTDF